MSAPAASPLPALLLEDDPSVRQFLILVLRDLGLEAKVTDSAAEAVRWIADQDFALALLDYHVKDGTGLDVARALRARSPSMPIFMMSGAWTPEERRAAEAVPRVSILEKPLDVARLRAALERHRPS